MSSPQKRDEFGITQEMAEEARLYRKAKEIADYAEIIQAQMITKHWTSNEMDAFCIYLIRSLK
jgi:hypothetical protein